MTQTIQSLIQVADAAGFEQYGSFNEGELQHEILTCTKGERSGEVIDIYWYYRTGVVSSTEVSAQFKGQVPTFKF